MSPKSQDLLRTIIYCTTGSKNKYWTLSSSIYQGKSKITRWIKQSPSTIWWVKIGCHALNIIHELGYLQTKTKIYSDNLVAKGIANDEVTIRKSKAFHTRYPLIKSCKRYNVKRRRVATDLAIVQLSLLFKTFVDSIVWLNTIITLFGASHK